VPKRPPAPLSYPHVPRIFSPDSGGLPFRFMFAGGSSHFLSRPLVPSPFLFFFFPLLLHNSEFGTGFFHFLVAPPLMCPTPPLVAPPFFSLPPVFFEFLFFPPLPFVLLSRWLPSLFQQMLRHTFLCPTLAPPPQKPTQPPANRSLTSETPKKQNVSPPKHDPLLLAHPFYSKVPKQTPLKSEQTGPPPPPTPAFPLSFPPSVCFCCLDAWRIRSGSFFICSVFLFSLGNSCLGGPLPTPSLVKQDPTGGLPSFPLCFLQTSHVRTNRLFDLIENLEFFFHCFFPCSLSLPYLPLIHPRTTLVQCSPLSCQSGVLFFF